jgi:hypothetical protein
MTLRAMLLFSFVALSGCATAPPVSSGISLDPSSRPACEQHCSVLGMQLTAVVIYSSRVGCVCEVKPAQAGASTLSGAGVAAAGEVINEEAAAQTPTQTSQH